MSTGSQLTVAIINYISIAGLLACGLLSFFTDSKKRKLILVFFSFLSGGIFYFVYYSDVLFFIIGIIILFFFTLLYYFVFQMEFFGNNAQVHLNEEIKSSRRKKKIITTVAIAIFFLIIWCFACGYLHGYLSDLTDNLSVAAGVSSSSFIPTLSDISRQLSTDYGIVILILAASLFVSSLWFMIIKMEKK